MSQFINAWNDTAERVHETAITKGWWNTDRSDGECIALMHSELSEALEALRTGNPVDSHCPEFSSLEVELADLVIRVLDYSMRRGLDVASALEAKMKYNTTRQYKHGKEF